MIYNQNSMVKPVHIKEIANWLDEKYSIKLNDDENRKKYLDGQPHCLGNIVPVCTIEDMNARVKAEELNKLELSPIDGENYSIDFYCKLRV